MNYEAQLRIAGAVQIGLALMHLAFPRRFRWDEEMARLSPLNRQMFHVHTLFVCVVLVMIGGLSLFAPAALLEPTSLSRLVLIGFAGFWVYVCTANGSSTTPACGAVKPSTRSCMASAR